VNEQYVALFYELLRDATIPIEAVQSVATCTICSSTLCYKSYPSQCLSPTAREKSSISWDSSTITLCVTYLERPKTENEI